MDDRSPLDAPRLSRMLAQALESAERSGVTHMPKIRRQPSRVTQPAATPDPTAVQAFKGSEVTIARTLRPAPSVGALPVPDIGSQPLEGPVLKTRAERVAALDVIQAEVRPCIQCHELATTRTQTVFGVGNPLAQLCFVGEAPGADEDERGEPFVGRAGQLLTKIIEACQLKREDVFILNVLKCRPPGNRAPLPDEVANCRPFLDRQLAVIRPQYICCLGTTAAQTLLQTDRTIGQLRGKFHDYRGIPVMCTYHPAYLLRNPAAKRDVWEDMKKLMAKLGVNL